jgi:hypothetical protein
MTHSPLRRFSCALALLATTHDASRSSGITSELRNTPSFLCSGAGDDLEIVGQIPDIVLTAGVAQNRTVTHRQVVYPAYPLVPNGYLPYHECGAIARSNTPGLSIRSTYFDIGVNHPSGEWAGLGGSHGSEGLPRVLSPIGLEVIVDGSAPAGTVGNIEIAQNIGDDGVGYIPRIIGVINVYVIAPGTPPPITWFTVIGSAASIAGNRIVLDHSLLNGRPNNRIFVTHSITPPGSPSGISWPHPVSVSYDGVTQRWGIQNDDAAPMPPGIGFNVRIDPGAKLFTVRRRPNTLANTVTSLVISDPRANYNPYATIFVTPASPGGHPVAVRYVAPYWQIVNADTTPIRVDQRFFVQFLGATAYRDDRWRGAREYNPLGSNAISNGSGVDIDGIGPRRVAGDSRYLDFYWARRSSVPLIITANQTPLGRAAYVDTNFAGVSFTGGAFPANTWAVRHESGAAMVNNASFNVWGPAYTSLRPPVDSLLNRDRVIRSR